MNIYRLIGDACLISATPIMAYQVLIHGPDGISLTTQILRLLMFGTRYIDVLVHPISLYNTLMKCFLILSTLMLVIMLGRRKLASSGQKSWMHELSLGLVIVTTGLLASTQFTDRFTLMGILWTFSRIIEPFVEIPQLTQVYRMDVLDACIITYYSSAGAQVVFYFGNWIYRYYQNGFFDRISVVCALAEILVISRFFIARHVNMKKKAIVGDLDSKEHLDDKTTYVVDQKMPMIVVEEVA